jgi:hypothetical protein
MVGFDNLFWPYLKSFNFWASYKTFCNFLKIPSVLGLRVKIINGTIFDFPGAKFMPMKHLHCRYTTQEGLDVGSFYL